MNIVMIYIKNKRWGMVVNETTLNQRPNDIEVKDYRSLNNFNNEQSIYTGQKSIKGPEMTNVEK